MKTAAALQRHFSRVVEGALAPVVAGATVFCGLAVLYGLGACRDLYWDDSAEFVYVAKILGVAHPSGYPLYTLLAAAAVRLPLSAPYALSLFSSLCAAGAMALLFVVLRRLAVLPWPAAFAALFVGSMASLVDQATAPEVYALHLLLQLAIVERALALRADGRAGRAAGLGLSLGLSFANHLTTVWLLMPLAVLLWPARRKLKSRHAALALGGIVIGLLPYLYLPWRAAGGSLWAHGDPDSWGRFWAHVAGEAYRYRLFSLSLSEFAEQVDFWAGSLAGQWGAWMLAALPFGVWALAARKDRGAIFAALLWLAIGLAYVWNYFIPDKEGYYLVPHLVVGLIVVAGLGRLGDAIARRLAAGWRKPLLVAFALLTLAWPTHEALRHSRAQQTALTDFTVDVWRSLEPRSLFITQDITLHYAVELLRRDGLLGEDAAVVAPYFLAYPWYQRYLARRYADLVLPPDLAEGAKAFAAAGGRGEQGGREKQIIVDRLSRMLVAANLDHRPVALYLHRDDETPGEWQGFPLQNRGLVYKVGKAADGPPDWRCDYAARYLAGKQSFVDPRDRFVAWRYANACNRLGIAESAAGHSQAAAAAFGRALRYDPGYAEAMKNKGLILLRDLKDETQGRALWKQYLELAGEKADPAVKRYMNGQAP
ncbi:MAG: DUF2723 domain-containing protein [Myxococcales bacterium]|nr:MAG: DUF2723 domain-containing protein [Myxococcales bacterium]